jgi:hypothetical protein
VLERSCAGSNNRTTFSSTRTRRGTTSHRGARCKTLPGLRSKAAASTSSHRRPRAGVWLSSLGIRRRRRPDGAFASALKSPAAAFRLPPRLSHRPTRASSSPTPWSTSAAPPRCFCLRLRASWSAPGSRRRHPRYVQRAPPSNGRRAGSGTTPTPAQLFPHATWTTSTTCSQSVADLLYAAVHRSRAHSTVLGLPQVVRGDGRAYRALGESTCRSGSEVTH